MLLDELGDESVEGPTRAGDLLKNEAAAFLLFERSLHGLELSADPSHAGDELLLLTNGVHIEGPFARDDDSIVPLGMTRHRAVAFVGVLATFSTIATFARAHHEALFGPQSSLAVESEAFVSLQSHEHVFGSGASLDREATYILSAGVTPFRAVPWSLTLVQAYTFESAASPTGTQTGPFSSCGGCFTRENLLVSTSYRFDFAKLQRATGKDGNFALVSGSLEPPTGAKDYQPLHGPFNGIVAAMTGFEWSHYALVGLGYYRINAIDAAGSKKGNNWLAGLGFAYTPVDHEDRLVSVQLGLAAEIHDRDVATNATLDRSGGWELFASPTVVWSPARAMRFFAYVSLPFAQDYRDASQEDRWRAGLGVIYSFERAQEPKVAPPSL